MNVKVNFLLLSIIKELDTGNSAVEIRKRWNWTRQRFSLWLKKLEKLGFIERKGRTTHIIYEVSPIGKEFYTRCMQSVPLGQVELHHASWIYDLYKIGSLTPDKVTKKDISIKRLSNITVSWSREHLIIYVAKEFGDNAFLLMENTKNKAESMANQLRGMGFEIDNPVLNGKAHFGVIDAVAAKVAKEMAISTPDYDINASEGYGELEFHSPEQVQDYVRATIEIGKILPGLKQSIDLEIYNKQLHQKVLEKMLETLEKMEAKLK